MKKISNITLGQVVFAVEQDAFDVLSTYLEKVKASLPETEDRTEVLEDIEGALAEKFLARKKSEKRAVTAADVSEVTTEMGSPSDFGEGQTDEKETPTSSAEQSTKKRLFRDADDAVIAGVASGIAQYFEIDPVIVRILFFISIFFNGLGLIAYIVLWVVVPKAQTTTDKYAMRGEMVTLKEITQRVKKNLEKIDREDLVHTGGLWNKVRGFFVKLFDVLGVLVRGVIHIARYVVGLAFVLGGALGTAGLVSVYSVVLLSEKVLFPQEVQVALDTMLGSALGIVAITASFVMMVIPLLVLIITGASLLAKRNFFTVSKTVGLAVVWIVAMILAATTSALQVEQVMQKLGVDEFTDGQVRIEIGDDHIYIDTDVVAPHPPTAPEYQPVACTADAKICSDGTGVGRTGPYCEFAACPDDVDVTERLPDAVVCTDAQKKAEICTMEYAPVCGLVEVQCITSPCPPISETFGNACSACGQGNVTSYTQGECELPEAS